ncbi:unnamed protein product, partial [Closterium sp. NIES-54]
RLSQQPGGAAIPANFSPTAPPHDPDRPHARMPTFSSTTLNPQTAAFLDLLDLPHSTFLRGGAPSPSPAPPPAAAASPTIWNSDSCPPDTFEDPDCIPTDGDADDGALEREPGGSSWQNGHEGETGGEQGEQENRDKDASAYKSLDPNEIDLEDDADEEDAS